ncbi:hypothetical protein QYF50_00050 [Paenibacillus vini]|uniref:hypothetical protein n=1 Tax=Paenibacillus vini TaxID=1476024 RepID=UPI0025B6FB7F|nr:hypothetical protein [Paenibacillus vini]MDN4066265.1 hypothetical protein [Paenibacillus vini]
MSTALGLIGREDANGNYVSYHSDIRGSTTLLTDEQGSVTDRYTYGIYGELEQHEGNTHQPFQYNGRDGVMTDPNGCTNEGEVLRSATETVPEPRRHPRLPDRRPNLEPLRLCIEMKKLATLLKVITRRLRA